MPNANLVVIMGNLVKKPELKHLQSGTPLAKMRLAINNVWMKDGEKKKDTIFIQITAWNKQAENAVKYLEKGAPIHIIGRLSMHEWDDKDSGEKKSYLGVTAREIQYLSGKKDGQPKKEKLEEAEGAPEGGGEGGGGGGDEDDTPF